MSNFYSENIYSDDFFNAYKLDNSIVVELKQDNNLIISSWHNGGYNENMTHVVNQTLEGNDYNNFHEGFFDDFHKEKIASLGLNPTLLQASPLPHAWITMPSAHAVMKS